MRWEVDALTEELKGTASDLSKAYPANLGFIDHYKWIPLPTVVYELEYPRSNDISVPYVAEKLVAMVGVIFVMIQVSQYSICKPFQAIGLPSGVFNNPDYRHIRSRCNQYDRNERAWRYTFPAFQGISLDSE
jgi:hypothetical protein